MDRKLLIFLLLFFASYFLYFKFVLEPIEKKTPPPPSRPSTTATSPQQPVAAGPPQTTQSVPVPTVQPSLPQTANVDTAIVDTALYHAEIMNKGAVLKSFRLKKYTDDYSQPLEMIPQSVPPGQAPLSLDFGDSQLNRSANESYYTMDRQRINLSGGESAGLEFRYSDGPNVFRKQFVFKADSYLIDCNVEATRGNSHLPLRIIWAPGLETLKSYKKAIDLKPSRAVVNTGQNVERKTPKDATEFQKVGATVRWAGVENNYFIATFIPLNQPADAFMKHVPSGEAPKMHEVEIILAGQKPEPLNVRLFVGPKDYYLLRQLGMGLEHAVNFGFFGPIARALFITLRKLHDYTNNYGWSIVLMTILVKIIFTPFTQKSFSSMKKMQTMQPELKKIQDKYAKIKNDDPRKQNMNAEIMQLHKRYGVNPLGGCLPMLLQMPVLFAFYSVLSNAIEMRKAPFGLWIQDLSRPDPYHITPIIMGVTMLLQQRMTPSSDPMQQKMMYIMPIMFTYISFNLQSGLVIYWLLSNVLAIAHQYYFQRQQKMVPASAALKENNVST